ncbi:MAG: tyrosine--tRNA ligase, partial [Bacteroidota bacterium]
SESAQQIKRIFAEEITVRIHGHEAYAAVQAVSALLFDPKADASMLKTLDKSTLAQVADEIPSPEIATGVLENPVSILDFLSDQTGILPSRSEAKRAVQSNMISINKVRITDLGATVSSVDLLHGAFVMVESGKKNKYLVRVV